MPRRPDICIIVDLSPALMAEAERLKRPPLKSMWTPKGFAWAWRASRAKYKVVLDYLALPVLGGAAIYVVANPPHSIDSLSLNVALAILVPAMHLMLLYTRWNCDVYEAVIQDGPFEIGDSDVHMDLPIHFLERCSKRCLCRRDHLGEGDYTADSVYWGDSAEFRGRGLIECESDG